VVRKTSVSKMDEVTREWRRLHNEELPSLYFLPNIIRVITIRIMRRAGRVACMGDRMCIQGVGEET
jgi:hypothetical protein